MSDEEEKGVHTFRVTPELLEQLERVRGPDLEYMLRDAHRPLGNSGYVFELGGSGNLPCMLLRQLVTQHPWCLIASLEHPVTNQTIFRSRAIIAAWVRFLAPSLRHRVLTCSLTVTS